MDRRRFLIGCAAVFAAPAVPEIDPLVKFVSYQSWPYGEPRPSINWSVGMIGSKAADAPRYPLSQMLRPLRPHMAYFRIEA